MPNGLKDTAAIKVEPLTVDNVNQIAEGIEHFVMDGDPDVDALWEPCVTKLRDQRHLIAAAPELLAALKAMVASYDSLRESLWSEVIIAKLNAADAAIAKAEGRS